MGDWAEMRSHRNLLSLKATLPARTVQFGRKLRIRRVTLHQRQLDCAELNIIPILCHIVISHSATYLISSSVFFLVFVVFVCILKVNPMRNGRGQFLLEANRRRHGTEQKMPFPPLCFVRYHRHQHYPEVKFVETGIRVKFFASFVNFAREQTIFLHYLHLGVLSYVQFVSFIKGNHKKSVLLQST